MRSIYDVRPGVRWLAGGVIVAGAWQAGNGLVAVLPISVPGSIAGLGLLFLTFALFRRSFQISEPAGRLLLRHFPLFLYPLGAGFLSLNDLDATFPIKLLITVTVSLVISLTACVAVFRFFKRHDG